MDDSLLSFDMRLGAAVWKGMTTMEWQPIETAPKDGRLILAWEEQDMTYRLIFWGSSEWRYGPFGVECSPTHWMPLPDPPPKRD